MQEPQAARPWRVYVVEAGDGRLYVGVTTDLTRRLAQHAGRVAGGAAALRGRGPVWPVWVEAAATQGDALRREAALKRLGTAARRTFVAEGPWAEPVRAAVAWLAGANADAGASRGGLQISVRGGRRIEVRAPGPLRRSALGALPAATLVRCARIDVAVTDAAGVRRVIAVWRAGRSASWRDVEAPADSAPDSRIAFYIR